MASRIFQKLANVQLTKYVVIEMCYLVQFKFIDNNRNENVSSSPIIGLLEQRATTLQKLSLTDFDDLPSNFIDAIKLCKELVSLAIKNTNVTLPEILNLLEHVQLTVLAIPGMLKHNIRSLTPPSFS